MARKKPQKSKGSKQPGVTVALTDDELILLTEAGRIPRRLLVELIQKTPEWFVSLSESEARDLLKKKPVLKPSQAGRSIIQAYIRPYDRMLGGEIGPVWITQLPLDLSTGSLPPEMPDDIGPVEIRDRRAEDPPEVLTMTVQQFWQVEAGNLVLMGTLPPNNSKHRSKRPHSLRIALSASDETLLRNLADHMRLEPSVLARLAIVRFVGSHPRIQEVIQNNKLSPHA